MRKILFGLIIISILLLPGCKKSSTEIVSELQLPKNIRAMSTKWQEDRLFYLTDQGINAFFPSNSSTMTLMSEDISKRDISWTDYLLSPDKSKFILLTTGSYDNTLEIRDATKDASIMVLDTQKYREGVGQHSPFVYEAGWFDNENIFLSTEYRLFIINILTGEEVQVTEECSPVTTKVSHNTEAPYLYWARNITKINNKLYYNSVRNVKNFPQNIYYGNKTGEKEIIKDAAILVPVDNKSFVYLSESSSGDFETLLYNIEKGSSLLISDTKLLRNGIFKTNNGKLCFMTGDITGGIYKGVIFDPDTMQIQEYDAFNGSRDFSEDTDRMQFGHFMGALEKEGEYTFLFSVETLDKSQHKYLKSYFAYNTKTKNTTSISGYNNFWNVNFQIDSSGEYILVIKHQEPGKDGFLFDIIKADDLI